MERGLCLLLGYLCGCFLTAEAVAWRHAGQSAAALGSGNPGMANIASQLGRSWGAVVLLGDIAKTILAWLLGRLLCPGLALAPLWTGLGAVLGHNFPFWRGFRGGHLCLSGPVFPSLGRPGLSGRAGGSAFLRLPAAGRGDDSCPVRPSRLSLVRAGGWGPGPDPGPDDVLPPRAGAAPHAPRRGAPEIPWQTALSCAIISGRITCKRGETAMHNELTKKDIQMMREELHQRRTVLRPQLLEAVKEARAFGDLSENFEYKAAKQEKNQNERRIRFLENMIRTAVVISDQSQADTVGLFDKVTIRLADDDVDETYQVVTTMRQDALRGRISKESPVGKALLGRRVGERFHIQVSERYGYDAVVRAIEKSEDDGSAPLNRF